VFAAVTGTETAKTSAPKVSPQSAEQKPQSPMKGETAAASKPAQDPTEKHEAAAASKPAQASAEKHEAAAAPKSAQKTA
jgi:hypothetical protein